MKRLILILAISLCLLTACSRTSITTTQPAYGIPVKNTSHHFLWGLAGDNVETSGRISRTEVYKGFGDHILTWLTLGLYSPWSVKIWHADSKE